MGLVAQDGVAHVVVVGHLDVVEQDHVFQLRGVAHHAVVAHQGVAPDEGAGTHLGLVADDAGAADVGGGEDRGVPGDPDVLRDLGVIVFLRGEPAPSARIMSPMPASASQG